MIVWDVVTRSARHRCKTPLAPGIAFSYDGKSLAVAGGRWPHGQIRFLDTESGQWAAHVIPCHYQGMCVRFIRDGDHLVSGESGGTFAVWNIARGERLHSSQTGSIVSCMAVSPDGETLAAGLGDSTVTLWHLATLKQVGTLQTPSIPTSMEFSRDGQTLAAGCTDASVMIWDINGTTVHHPVGFTAPDATHVE